MCFELGVCAHLHLFLPVSIGVPARLRTQNQIITSFLGKKVEYKHLLLFIYIYLYLNYMYILPVIITKNRK